MAVDSETSDVALKKTIALNGLAAGPAVLPCALISRLQSSTSAGTRFSKPPTLTCFWGTFSLVCCSPSCTVRTNWKSGFIVRRTICITSRGTVAE